MLVRCLYASRAHAPLDSAAVEAILQVSRTNNARNGITGLLCHSNDIFVQVLEGGRPEVSALYNTIARDDRHGDVTLLSYAEIPQRRFANWTMGQVNLAKINPGLMLKYGARASLDPLQMSGEATLALLDDLIESAAILTRST